jgi:anti-sigma factor RsiW
MDCAEIERRLWEYLDGALPPEEAAAVRGHLGHCAGCGPACQCCRAFLRLLSRAHRSQTGASEILKVRLRLRIAQEI